MDFHSKGLNLPRWGIFGIPLTQDLTKIMSWSSHIIHHTSHIASAFLILQNISDQNKGAIDQFIKADSEVVCPKFFDEKHRIDNTNP